MLLARNNEAEKKTPGGPPVCGGPHANGTTVEAFYTEPAINGPRATQWRGHSSNAMLSMLERIGCGYLVLEGASKVVEANSTAYTVLEREAGTIRSLEQLYRAFRRLVDRARRRDRPRLGAVSWVIVSSKDDAPLILNQAAADMSDGMSLVMLLDLDAYLKPNPLMLQQMFGLTTAETRLALQIAKGEVPAEIALRLCLSRTTVRSQLASVFAKTQTKRQAELVRLLARVAVLP